MNKQIILKTPQNINNKKSETLCSPRCFKILKKGSTDLHVNVMLYIFSIESGKRLGEKIVEKLLVSAFIKKGFFVFTFRSFGSKYTLLA